MTATLTGARILQIPANGKAIWIPAFTGITIGFINDKPPLAIRPFCGQTPPYDFFRKPSF